MTVMPSYKVEFTVQRKLTCFVEADSEQHVRDFLNHNDEWAPGDTPGLIDIVGDEEETGFEIFPEPKVVPNFLITSALTLDER